ncbi:MAG TPA: peptidyl-prolyl cis-trans isomerase [Acidobacteriaceae bacterium]|nr:peptidyl-prolyl cis-trans isomerase [Acidobacteriaceae bacterium]
MIRSLQQDNRASKAIFAVVIGLAILAMVVTLVPGIFDNSTANNTANFATVRQPGWFGRFGTDSVTITNAEVQNTARRMLAQNQLPEMYLPLVMSRAGEQQVERAVLIQEADRLGLQVSNEDLRREFQSGPLSQYLFPNGQYIGDEAYANFVSQRAGMSVVNFESAVKQDIELQRLQALVTGGVSVSDAQARAAYLKDGEKAKFDYAVISASDLKKTINPSDGELEQFFKSNAARYATAVPEARKIAVFEVDNAAIAGSAPKATDAEVQAYYNAHPDEFKVPEEVKTRHILLTVPKGADAKTDAAAKAKAQDLLKQIRGGANFAELAMANSDDPGSKASGGELPMIPTSNLDPAYARAAMALSPGQTSDVVRSQFGYHIIQTEQKQPASTKSLAEVKDEISGKLTAQKFVAAQNALAAQLASEAQKNGMAATAKAHNLPLTTTDFVTRDGTVPSVPDPAALLSAAFGAAKGAAPQTVSTGEGNAVFQVVDVRAAHAPAFADWKSHVLDDYRDQKVPALLTAQLQKLDARAKQLGDLRKAAAEMNVPIKTSDLVGRDGQVQDVGSMSGDASVIFSLPKGGISAPINEGPNGVVAQLLELDQPPADDINKNLPAVKDKLLDQQRAEAFNVFAGTLMERYQNAGAILYSRKPTGAPLGS